MWALWLEFPEQQGYGVLYRALHVKVLGITQLNSKPAYELPKESLLWPDVTDLLGTTGAKTVPASAVAAAAGAAAAAETEVYNGHTISASAYTNCTHALSRTYAT
jgi:hypothetical protein